MFYKACLALTLGIVALSIVGSLASANSVTVSKQDYVDNTARQRIGRTYFVPIPGGSIYRTGGGSGGSGSSRSSYDGVRGGGPGSGK